jgi:hypothetical protein
MASPRHVQFTSAAAVKFLLPHLDGDSQLEDRFLEEARRGAGCTAKPVAGNDTSEEEKRTAESRYGRGKLL